MNPVPHLHDIPAIESDIQTTMHRFTQLVRNLGETDKCTEWNEVGAFFDYENLILSFRNNISGEDHTASDVCLVEEKSGDIKHHLIREFRLPPAMRGTLQDLRYARTTSDKFSVDSSVEIVWEDTPKLIQRVLEHFKAAIDTMERIEKITGASL